MIQFILFFYPIAIMKQIQAAALREVNPHGYYPEKIINALNFYFAVAGFVAALFPFFSFKWWVALLLVLGYILSGFLTTVILDKLTRRLNLYVSFCFYAWVYKKFWMVAALHLILIYILKSFLYQQL